MDKYRIVFYFQGGTFIRSDSLEEKDARFLFEELTSAMANLNDSRIPQSAALGDNTVVNLNQVHYVQLIHGHTKGLYE